MMSGVNGAPDYVTTMKLGHTAVAGNGNVTAVVTNATKQVSFPPSLSSEELYLLNAPSMFLAFPGRNRRRIL